MIRSLSCSNAGAPSGVSYNLALSAVVCSIAGAGFGRSADNLIGLPNTKMCGACPVKPPSAREDEPRQDTVNLYNLNAILDRMKGGHAGMACGITSRTAPPKALQAQVMSLNPT